MQWVRAGSVETLYSSFVLPPRTGPTVRIGEGSPARTEGEGK